MFDHTDRHALPLLHAGQAQKEMTHNEALAMLDLLAAPAVEAMDAAVPPQAPAPGQCWLLGEVPEGDWAGRPGALAGWTVSGWRFVDPNEGMAVWVRDRGVSARRVAGEWRIGAVLAGAPDTGSVRDVEAREAIAAIVALLRSQGISEA